MLKAGSLDRRISIQVQAVVQDEYGQQTNTWDDLMTCWASINVVTSKEVYAASGFTSEVSHKITIRYPALTIRSNMRVLYAGRIFTVQAVMCPDESRVQLDMLCLEQNEGK